MSRLAGQLIMHPQITQGLGLVATTIGRDKVFRLIQYTARLLAWSMMRRGDIDGAARFDGLKTGLANVRKGKLFRPAEFLQSAVKLSARPVTSLQGPGQLAHVSQIVKQLLMATYYGTDMLIWLTQVGTLRLDKERLARISRISQKAWLFGILSSLVSSGSSLVKLRGDSRRYMLSREVARREAVADGEKQGGDRVSEEEDRREKGRALLQQRQQILSQLVMDACDVWIPATNVGYTNLNDGVLGALGTITSYMALQTLWIKHAAVARK
ncbi:peroxisomal biogenesis factor 11 [Dioszegia hungarica]|uniref:Peroxisomal biogenesis factor 11 n=1 Tax=Dioszegia hungarica TaxID=4972 RepID=A0AA38LZ99_9TREE|nr:peroxisomal biogenesis factor 11 [Dioszegia hungarica]KAI9639839.1 peroxisomal biogenesis factor 11 [Dioszegia hungarica]